MEILTGKFQVPQQQEFDALMSHVKEYLAEAPGENVHLGYLRSKKLEGSVAGAIYEDDIVWSLVCDRMKLEGTFSKYPRFP